MYLSICMGVALYCRNILIACSLASIENIITVRNPLGPIETSSPCALMKAGRVQAVALLIDWSS